MAKAKRTRGSPKRPEELAAGAAVAAMRANEAERPDITKDPARKAQTEWAGAGVGAAAVSIGQTMPVTADHQRESWSNDPGPRPGLAAGHQPVPFGLGDTAGTPVTRLDYQQVRPRDTVEITTYGGASEGGSGIGSSIQQHQGKVRVQNWDQMRAAAQSYVDQLRAAPRGVTGIGRFPEQTAGTNPRDMGGPAPRPVPPRGPGSNIPADRTPIADRQMDPRYGNAPEQRPPGQLFGNYFPAPGTDPSVGRNGV